MTSSPESARTWCIPRCCKRGRRRQNGNHPSEPDISSASQQVAHSAAHVSAHFSTLSIESTVAHELLQTNATHGLPADEAAARLERHGPNKLSEGTRERWIVKLLRQLNSIIYLVLTAAAIISAVLQEWAETALIIVVIVGNVSLSMYLESKAEESIRALRAMLTAKATVIRGGVRERIDVENIVIGDLIVVEAGQRAPADARLVLVNEFSVDESMLTGESDVVHKHTNLCEPNAPLGDQKNMLFSATLAARGQAMGIVVATGDKTAFGQIKKLTEEVKVAKNHLLYEVERFGRFIARFTLVIAVISFVVAYFSSEFYHNVGHSLTVAVAVGVAVIPEGLAAVVTITLALSMQRMSKNNAIVRSLPAVETLGSVTVICSDKTGTLTKNEMTVVSARTAEKSYTVTGVGYDPNAGTVPDADDSLKKMISFAITCSDAFLSTSTPPVVRGRKHTQDAKKRYIPVGPPTEVCLVTLAEKIGMDVRAVREQNPRVHAVPFDSEHKFNATIHENTEATQYPYIAFVKGAPDRLLTRCKEQLVSATDMSTKEVDTEFWKGEISAFGSKGLRCLALCVGLIPDGVDVKQLRTASFGDSSKVRLVMCAIVGIMDPPREECIVAIREAHHAGIKVKMITGDHPETALAIGKVLGLLDSAHQRHYTGVELDAMSPSELDASVMHCNIFARTSPANKLQIVQALGRNHQVSCMTGDGTNDAPALRAADIGVAMGITGTDVAKEAAKMVLVDDNFASIVVAVKEGRKVWDNIVKILVFNNPVNFAQGLSVLFALILQFTSVPLTTVQVLYVNLVTSVTLGIMLALEPPEPDIMKRPPRAPKERLVGPLFYWRVVFVATMVVVVVLGGFAWCYSALNYSLDESRTVAASILIFCQITYGFSCRFLYSSAITKDILYGNPVAWLCALIVFVLQVFLVYTPEVNDFFGMAPMDGAQWGIVLLFPTVIFLVVELEKLVHRSLVMVYLQPRLKHYARKLHHCFNSRMCCQKMRKSDDMAPNSPVHRKHGEDANTKEPETDLEAGISEPPSATSSIPNVVTESRQKNNLSELTSGPAATASIVGINGQHGAEQKLDKTTADSAGPGVVLDGAEENRAKAMQTETEPSSSMPDISKKTGVGIDQDSNHSKQKSEIKAKDVLAIV